MRYPLIIHDAEDDGTVTIEIDGLPGVTWGASRKEALANAMALFFEVCAEVIADGSEFPDAPPAGERPTVAVPLVLRLKHALIQAREAAGISKAELARRIGIRPQRMTQLLDPAHNSRVAQLEAAIEALGCEIAIEVRPKAA